MHRAPSLPPWLRVALLAVGLLLVPLAAWLLIPEPEPPKRVATRTIQRVDPQEAEEDEVEEEEARPVRAPESEEPAAPEPTDEISGMVVAGAAVVPSASVTCKTRSGEELRTTTLPSGRFSFPKTAEGCRAVARSGSHGVSPEVELKLGDDNRLELPGQGSMAGTVVDDRGRPVESFLVDLDHAWLADGTHMPGGVQRKFNDPEGRFSLERLAPGRWTVVVSAPDRPPTKVEVEVAAGKATEDVRVKLPRGAMLLGSVIDRETHRPIGGAIVRLDGASAVEPATTSPGGDFRLEGVPTATFGIEIRHPEYMTRIVSGLDAKGQRQFRTTIDLAKATDEGRLEMSGIGASLGGDPDGRVRVSSVRAEGPAERAGMQAEDVIAAIDGKSAEGLSVGDCVQLLRGPAGSEVSVAVQRDGARVEMRITRDVIVH